MVDVYQGGGDGRKRPQFLRSCPDCSQPGVSPWLFDAGVCRRCRGTGLVLV